jgi:hypothetical protein
MLPALPLHSSASFSRRNGEKKNSSETDISSPDEVEDLPSVDEVEDISSSDEVEDISSSDE